VSKVKTAPNFCLKRCLKTKNKRISIKYFGYFLARYFLTVVI